MANQLQLKRKDNQQGTSVLIYQLIIMLTLRTQIEQTLTLLDKCLQKKRKKKIRKKKIKDVEPKLKIS